MRPRRLAPLLALAAVACGDDDRSLIGIGDVVETTPERMTLAVGDSGVLLVRVRTGDGRARPARIGFASNASDVADVRVTSDSTAVVRARSAGTGSVTVQTPDRSATVTIPVDVHAPAAVPTPARDTTPLFQTDSLAYTLRRTFAVYEVGIAFTFRNATADTAHIVNCGGRTGVALERLRDGVWEPFWDAVNPTCLSPAIVVPPGASYRHALSVYGGLPGSDVVPRFPSAELGGTYRAVFHDVLRSYQDRLPFGEPFPVGARRSNAFVLRMPAR
ncbi:hypothetical protein [Roseisolibacter sp. H3M3-2]|uniref:hypothetical protein n=1 Tax=Roseisolibacter sp. H3M3-2 TaxID=3031323 RepID=UPI0023DC48EC|nr:hypothetical protein [Roseisolibacter sp. H3M3-2]MDF1504443.1 hypothetical protein [Roseisolibacter sp. H3M3-2]